MDRYRARPLRWSEEKVWQKDGAPRHASFHLLKNIFFFFFFSLLVFQGNRFHYWKYVLFVFFPGGLNQMEASASVLIFRDSRGLYGQATPTWWFALVV